MLTFVTRGKDICFHGLETLNQQKKKSLCPSDNSSKSEPILMNLFLKTSNLILEAKFEDEQNLSSGSGDIGKKVEKVEI